MGPVLVILRENIHTLWPKQGELICASLGKSMDFSLLTAPCWRVEAECEVSLLNWRAEEYWYRASFRKSLLLKLEFDILLLLPC